MANALVRAVSVVVFGKLAENISKVATTEQGHLAWALAFDRLHESFGGWMHVWHLVCGALDNAAGISKDAAGSAA